MDLLQEKDAWLMQQNRDYMSGLVTYSRPSTGQQTASPIPAKLGRTPYETDSGSGVVVTVEMRDYVISARDLVLGGSATKPQVGDRVTDAAGVWEAMLGPNQQCYADVEHDLGFRIHTKKVG